MKELFDKLGIEINNIKLYKAAFCHSSYANEVGNMDDYERLEFLGDAVVELIISEYLYKNNDCLEGELTKLRSRYVCENANYEYALYLGLNNLIKVGVGEAKDNGKYKKAIVADVFEALMGAIYLDLGYETVKRVILSIIVPFILNPTVNFFNDYKSVLQEYVQTEGKSVHYELIDERGAPHDKTFVMSVMIDNICYGEGIGSSKKDAEQEAAKTALQKMAN
ncbi:MAG: ribonuclease III [Bacilli bacterium]